jgi:hypothetical protein
VFAANAVAPPHQLDEGNGVDDVIVISGVLLLIAVVFLVIGLFGPLAWVYASIAVSVLSFVFLLVGVRQRRDIAPAGAAAPAAARGAAAGDVPDVTLVPAGGRRPSASAPSAPAAVLDDVAPPARTVERPRPAVATPVRRPRPTTASSSASSRLRGSSSRPRAVLPARLAETPAKKTAAKKAAPAKAAAKKAAPAKRTAA